MWYKKWEQVTSISAVCLKNQETVTFFDHLCISCLCGEILEANARHIPFKTIGTETYVTNRQLGLPFQFCKFRLLGEKHASAGKKYLYFLAFLMGGLCQGDDMVEMFVRTYHNP